MRHTEGKWELKIGANNLYRETIQKDPGGFQAVCQFHYTLYGPDKTQSQFVADIITASSEEGAANAGRIVQCVNSHDELVEALGQTANCIFAEDFDMSDIDAADFVDRSQAILECIDMARKALENAQKS